MGETTGNLGTASQYFFANNRGRSDDVIKDDGKSFADIFFSKLAKNLAAAAGEVEAYVRFIEIAANPDLGIFYHFSCHEHLICKEDWNPRVVLGLVVDNFFEKYFCPVR